MDFDYSAWQIVAVLATYAFAATGKGITGLGFSTTCLPFLTISIGLKDALPLLVIPSVSSNIMVMYSAGRFGESVRRFWPMLLATIPGLILGLWALSRINEVLAAGILGVMLLIWCVFSLSKPETRTSEKWEKRFNPVSGFLTGLINGVTGSQVIPSVPYLITLHLDRNVFIQTVNCSFTLSSFIMSIGLAHLGLFTFDAVILSVCGTVFVFGGLKLGELVRSYLSPEYFRFAILFMLAAMGISLIARAV